MGILDRIMSVIKHQDDEPTVSSHEFIWCNTSNEVTVSSQTGVEISDNIIMRINSFNKNMEEIFDQLTSLKEKLYY